MIIRIPATSANLGPGFDALGLSLALFNEVEITEQKFFCVSLSGEGSDRAWLKKNNVFLNIFREICSSLGGDAKRNFKFADQLKRHEGKRANLARADELARARKGADDELGR